MPSSFILWILSILQGKWCSSLSLVNAWRKQLHSDFVFWRCANFNFVIWKPNTELIHCVCLHLSVCLGGPQPMKNWTCPYILSEQKQLFERRFNVIGISWLIEGQKGFGFLKTSIKDCFKLSVFACFCVHLCMCVHAFIFPKSGFPMCRPGCPGIHSVDQAHFELKD